MTKREREAERKREKADARFKKALATRSETVRYEMYLRSGLVGRESGY